MKFLSNMYITIVKHQVSYHAQKKSKFGNTMEKLETMECHGNTTSLSNCYKSFNIRNVSKISKWSGNKNL